MSRSRSSAFVRAVRCAVAVGSTLAALSVRPAAAQSGYVVEDLGTLPGDDSSVALAINENGDVVG